MLPILDRINESMNKLAPVSEAGEVTIGSRYKVDFHYFRTYPRQEVIRTRLALHRGNGSVYVTDIRGDGDRQMAIVLGDPSDTARVSLAQVPTKFLQPMGDGELQYQVPQTKDAAGSTTASFSGRPPVVRQAGAPSADTMINRPGAQQKIDPLSNIKFNLKNLGIPYRNDTVGVQAKHVGPTASAQGGV